MKNVSQCGVSYELNGNGFNFAFMVFLKPNGTELVMFFPSSVGLMMEQCLGERKPCQVEINKSESFEAVHIVGCFRETVFFSILYRAVSPLWFL